MRSKPSRCEGCPAHKWGQSFVPPEGPTTARLVAFGQGPGEQEARQGRPFYEHAPAGERVTDWWHRSGLLRSQTLFLNVVWCWLPARFENGLPRGNREPTPKEIAACKQRHWGPFIQEHNLADPDRLWVSLGAPATRALSGLEGSVEKFVGTFLKVGGLGDGS